MRMASLKSGLHLLSEQSFSTLEPLVRLLTMIMAAEKEEKKEL